MSPGSKSTLSRDNLSLCHVPSGRQIGELPSSPTQVFQKVVQVHPQHGVGKLFKPVATNILTKAGHKTNSNLRNRGRVHSFVCF